MSGYEREACSEAIDVHEASLVIFLWKEMLRSL